MKVTDTLTTLFEHHLWANLRLFEACAALNDEQLDGKILGTYGSIREMLAHIVTAEQSYFARISTGKSYPRRENEPPMTLAQQVAALRVTGTGLIEWASKVDGSAEVEYLWEGVPRNIPKAIIVAQAINHATEHRSQIMATMTQLGVEPPDLQPWVYFDEMDQQG